MKGRIAVTGLSKRFTLHQRGGLTIPVLDGFSMTAEPGECVALTGPSGRGKSTVLRCLYGNYGADSGRILIDTGDEEVDLACASPQKILSLRRATIGYVSQFLRVVPRVATIDVVAERWLDSRVQDTDSVSADDMAMARECAARLLERLRLPESVWHLPPATFSGGEQQRVNLARGLVRPAPVLLLDEPTASLDAANREVVVELIHEAKRRGATIVGIFHDEAVRDAVADREVAL
ncbi:MAG: phosphonate C-P lyase system protein PhnL [Burkholderiaceae bacterium]